MSKIQNASPAYDVGYKAFTEGRPFYDNPYRHQYFEWEKGWKSAESDRYKKGIKNTHFENGRRKALERLKNADKLIFEKSNWKIFEEKKKGFNSRYLIKSPTGHYYGDQYVSIESAKLALDKGIKDNVKMYVG